MSPASKRRAAADFGTTICAYLEVLHMTDPKMFLRVMRLLIVRGADVRALARSAKAMGAGAMSIAITEIR